MPKISGFHTEAMAEKAGHLLSLPFEAQYIRRYVYDLAILNTCIAVGRGPLYESESILGDMTLFLFFTEGRAFLLPLQYTFSVQVRKNT